MCTMSMVHDHYRDQFPKEWPPQSHPWTGDAPSLKKLINDFRDATAAAAVVDSLTKQPDCVDPEKAKLQEHVARLERIIDALLSKAEANPPHA